ncbi:MAG: hypothetical protein HYZ51_03395 [Candidatus Doudnabacteria bacterium]|nr:hypothetical protein [Candidatus Doudnabacteria bacterium]
MPPEILDLLLKTANENQRASYLRLQQLLDMLSGNSSVNQKEATALSERIHKLQAGIFSGEPLTKAILDGIEKEVLSLTEPESRRLQ